MKNLIDLGNYPRNDVDLIAREFVRQVYLEVMGDYAKESEKTEEDRDQSVLDRIEELLKSIERVIILLDGDDKFLFHIHNPEENGESTSEEDAEYDRF
tara:strand:- start:1557 stop:1850 length:294 start_codon:yes stop_codon:yes gene_type:complete